MAHIVNIDDVIVKPIYVSNADYASHESAGITSTDRVKPVYIMNYDSLNTADSLLTTETDPTKVLAPDGTGGVEWIQGGVMKYDANNTLYSVKTVPIVHTTGVDSIEIGQQSLAFATADRSVVIGTKSPGASSSHATLGLAISGGEVQSDGTSAMAIGTGSYNNSLQAIAIGAASRVAQYSDNAIALGPSAYINTNHDYSVAIGFDVESTAANEFNIGVSNTNKITFDTWTVAAETPTATHTLPIKIGGNTYKVLLSNV